MPDLVQQPHKSKILRLAALCVVPFGFSPRFMPCQPWIVFTCLYKLPQLALGDPRRTWGCLVANQSQKMYFHFILLLNPHKNTGIVPPSSACPSPLSPNLQGRQCCPALPAGAVAASELCSCCLHHFMGKIIPSCISFASCYATAF